LLGDYSRDKPFRRMRQFRLVESVSEPENGRNRSHGLDGHFRWAAVISVIIYLLKGTTACARYGRPSAKLSW
jgi:hypothetical protein